MRLMFLLLAGAIFGWFVFGNTNGGVFDNANVASRFSVAVKDKNGKNLETRFPVPDGYKRVNQDQQSFGNFLRRFSLQPDGAPVRYYDGQIKGGQVHEAVFNLSVGTKNLQQCADAVMRMRAEYLYAQNRKSEIHFHLTNGFDMAYSKWMEGYRLQVKGNATQWVNSKQAMDTHETFMEYMEVVFNYAGTLSLSKELKKKNPSNIVPGDIWIYGGSPGHAVLVVDVAENASGERVFMIAQSYMPAQEMHILKNLNEPGISPWYRIPEGQFQTPEWTFEQDELKGW